MAISFFLPLRLISLSDLALESHQSQRRHPGPAVNHNNNNLQAATSKTIMKNVLIDTDKILLQQNEEIIGPGTRDDKETIRQAKLAIARNLSLARNHGHHDITDVIKSCNHVEDCRDAHINDSIVYYNYLDRPRYLCGLRIEAKGLLIFNSTYPKTTNPSSCHWQRHTLSTLFPVLPTLANQQQQHSSLLPPIQIGIRGVKPSRSTRFVPFRSCDVKCSFLNNNLNAQAIARTIVGTDWEISSSMEGPQYYASILQAGNINSNNNNHFSSTTSLDSDIPLPYFDWDDYAPNMRAEVPAVKYEKAIKGAVFMAKNCRSKNSRESLVKDLIRLSNLENNATKSSNASSSYSDNQLFRVDSVSRCLHNSDPPTTKVKDDKNEILNNYLFYLAFENQNARDYITEKLWGSLFRSGTLPIYFGAPNVADHVPPHSIINVGDFHDLDSFWRHLKAVANNRTLYESYHAWRNKPLPQHFIDKYNFTHTHSICRMARWAFAKLYGWGWDHATQTLQETSLLAKRELCWANANGLLNNPFREQWFTHAFRELKVQKEQEDVGSQSFVDGKDDSTCYNPLAGNQTQNQPRSIIMVGSIRRTVWSHDGMLDLLIEPINNAMVGREIVLEMTVPSLAETKGKAVWHRMGHFEFWLQKESFRMTVLTSHSIVLSSPKEGVIQMFITVPQYDLNSNIKEGSNKPDQRARDSPFRMRIVVEQVDVSRPSSQVRSYFGKLAAEDFFLPVERFIVLSEASPRAR